MTDPIPVNPGNPVSFLGDLDWEKRAIELARRRLDDIPQCAHADLKIKWTSDPVFGAVPVLFVVFDPLDLERPLPRVYENMAGRLSPCFTVRLLTMPGKRGPGGERLDGQRLTDVVRRAVEEYLAKHGIVVHEPLQ